MLGSGSMGNRLVAISGTPEGVTDRVRPFLFRSRHMVLPHCDKPCRRHDEQ